MLHIEAYIIILDAQSVRKVLESDPGQINYRNTYGCSLLHTLISCFHYDDPVRLKKAQNTLAVLFEYNIDPTTRTKVKSHMTAKEFAQHLGKPQELINKLEVYEQHWCKERSAVTQHPTSDLRRRHRGQGGNSSSSSSNVPNTASSIATQLQMS